MAVLGDVVSGSDENILASGVDPDIVKGMREIITVDNQPKSGPKQQESPQELIDIKQLGTYLKKHWTLVQTVNSSHAVVQRPREL